MKVKTPIIHNSHPIYAEKIFDGGFLIKFTFINDEGKKEIDYLSFDNEMCRDEHFDDIMNGVTTDW